MTDVGGPGPRGRAPRTDPEDEEPRRILLAGWFSFKGMGATAGDLMARDVAAEWLRLGNFDYDTAYAPPFGGGVDWRRVDPSSYSHLVFVCGPFYARRKVVEFLPAYLATALDVVDPLLRGPLRRLQPSVLEVLIRRFSHARLVGLDVSMLGTPDSWHPFDALLERDGRGGGRPDLAFSAQEPRVPVVGVIFVERQVGLEHSMHEVAERAVGEALARRHVARVEIDTRLDVTNRGGLHTPAEVESLIARMDLVVTTRLHGTVLAIKNGIPPVVVDPIAGGGKVRAQAQTIGWPMVYTADAVTPAILLESLDYCLTPEARAKAWECRDRAMLMVGQLRDKFLECLVAS